MKTIILFLTLLTFSPIFGQRTQPARSIKVLAPNQVMTTELLWSLGRVSAMGTSPDGETFLYRVSRTDIRTESSSSEYYLLNLRNNQVEQTDILDGKTFVQWDTCGLYARQDDD